jgi:serine/threonine protein phosphatase 1
LVEKHHAIALRGNHDQRLVDLIQVNNENIHRKFLEHGGRQTIQSYTQTELHNESISDVAKQINDRYSHHIDFLRNLPLYFEDENHIYVHAGINPMYNNWKEQSDYDFMYIKGEFHHSKINVKKVIVFGHTRTVELHNSPNIWFGDRKIGIDGGCAYGMQLNCLIYEAGSYSTECIQAE